MSFGWATPGVVATRTREQNMLGHRKWPLGRFPGICDSLSFGGEPLFASDESGAIDSRKIHVSHDVPSYSHVVFLGVPIQSSPEAQSTAMRYMAASTRKARANASEEYTLSVVLAALSVPLPPPAAWPPSY